MKNQSILLHTLFVWCSMLIMSAFFYACQPKPAETTEEPAPVKELAFESSIIADSLKLIWAHCPADITGDGIIDLVYVDNNGYGGSLYFLKGQLEPGLWEKQLIAERAPGRRILCARGYRMCRH